MPSADNANFRSRHSSNNKQEVSSDNSILLETIPSQALPHSLEESVGKRWVILANIPSLKIKLILWEAP
jgi:hypothetical protein